MLENIGQFGGVLFGAFSVGVAFCESTYWASLLFRGVREFVRGMLR